MRAALAERELVPTHKLADVERDDETMATAVHESGHAITGVLLGFDVRRVVLSDAPDVRGFVLHGPTDLDDAAVLAHVRAHRPPVLGADSLQRRIISLMAGPAAESVHRGRCCRLYGGWQDVFDAETLLGAAVRRPGWHPSVQALLDVFDAAAARLVRREWDWVTAVADALVLARRLDGAAVRRLRRTGS